MKKRMLICLFAVLLQALCSCDSRPAANLTLPDNLGLGTAEEQTEELSQSREETLPFTEEQPLSEEEQTQISQMDKNQISNTYTYLKDVFSDGVYYLHYTTQVKENRQTLKKEIVIASDGANIYIEEKHADYAYLVKEGTVTVMNTKTKTYESFDITGSEFTLDNYVDWHSWENYRGREFTAVSAGTRSRPKLTETFTQENESISFYYYRNVLSTVSGTDGGGEEWSCTVKTIHNEPKSSLFEIPAQYQGKSPASS